jgi:hypothetical protein
MLDIRISWLLEYSCDLAGKFCGIFLHPVCQDLVYFDYLAAFHSNYSSRVRGSYNFRLVSVDLRHAKTLDIRISRYILCNDADFPHSYIEILLVVSYAVAKSVISSQSISSIGF